MSETMKNLAKAFIGESQARNRYTMYAKVAKKEGYEQISELFETTALNEYYHAKVLFEALQSLKKKEKDNTEEFNVEATIPTVIGDTITNLKAAIAGEHYEHSEMYPEFAAKAKEEGFQKIAAKFNAIGKAEVHHEERYKDLLAVLEDNTVFVKDGEVYWVCRKCGYVHKGLKPPKICPVCDHPHNYFELKCETY